MNDLELFINNIKPNKQYNISHIYNKIKYIEISKDDNKKYSCNINMNFDVVKKYIEYHPIKQYKKYDNIFLIVEYKTIKQCRVSLINFIVNLL